MISFEKGVQMGVKAFVLYDFEPRVFFERFLQSPDFTEDELKQMAINNQWC
jgi:hypothetical protein